MTSEDAARAARFGWVKKWVSNVLILSVIIYIVIALWPF
jgi:hypothetical protein